MAISDPLGVTIAPRASQASGSAFPLLKLHLTCQVRVESRLRALTNSLKFLAKFIAHGHDGSSWLREDQDELYRSRLSAVKLLKILGCFDVSQNARGTGQDDWSIPSVRGFRIRK